MGVILARVRVVRTYPLRGPRLLISYQTRDPALPRAHPFQDVFLGWYWTSTTAVIDPAYAWYVHMLDTRSNGDTDRHRAWLRSSSGPEATRESAARSLV